MIAKRQSDQIKLSLTQMFFGIFAQDNNGNHNQKISGLRQKGTAAYDNSWKKQNKKGTGTVSNIKIAQPGEYITSNNLLSH